MKNIEGTKKVLKELLSLDHFYRVPEYQRPYSWDAEQFQDLVNDLLDANKEQEYFLGTIVVHKKDGVCDIVDGQQRLTTIMILMAVLRDLIKSQKFKDNLQEKIIQKENEVDGIPEKVRIEVKDREIFDELIITNNGTNKDLSGAKLPEPQWRYVLAITTFKNKLQPFSQKGLEDFAKFLNQNCVMIYLATTTFDDAFKLFTIVNDRGKQLRRIDILKANNISPTVVKSEVVRNNLAQKWEEWEKNLGGETFENILFLLRFMLLGEKPQSDLLVEFEDKIFAKGLATKGDKFIDLVCEYAQLYNDVFEDFSYFENDAHKNKYIGLIYIMNAEFRSNEWKAVIMLLYIKKYRLLDFDKFLHLIEMKYLEGWIGGTTKDMRIIGFGNVVKAINVSKEPREILSSELLKSYMDPLKNTIDDIGFYGKAYCKYVLCRLELLASENDVEKKIKAKSIEHILPQKPNEKSQWRTDFTIGDMQLWVDSLANLVLLSQSKNSTAYNYDFAEKKRKYLQKRISDYPRSIQILSYPEWTPAVLEERQQELINIVFDPIVV